ncbi:MAG: deoxyribodipyrimidine photolyase [Ignavibacteria bacterium CG_4_8_14_3_um_filter_37_9]|nr:deoxyribodipyrimidine photo-lyase [Ignavibacteria bacterium]PIW99777.1 MAG: deoxyribodipyrimidine photolyase [Ignavibacteria bacterium CG_4_8_14_3_um_filter_37_9]
MQQERIRLLQNGKTKRGSVLYWMSRDQRVHDNWALIFAQRLAIEKNEILTVAFCLQPNFLEATIRQYGFMLKGLAQIEKKLNSLNINFHLLLGSPEKVLPSFIVENDVSVLVSDFDPLRIKRIWKREAAKSIEIPFYEVDAHNIVPALLVSQKAEFGAYTIRPKIHRLLPDFLDEFPPLLSMKKNQPRKKTINWDKVVKSLKIDFAVKEVDWIKSGEDEAEEMLDLFLQKKLSQYNDLRNDPTKEGQSNLSPYLHFGQLSAQRIALHVKKYFPHNEHSEAFLEELIVRRELSDNFCYFNASYDSFEGFPQWAKVTLSEHKKDTREFVYSLQGFELAATHEPLWNAAQNELKNRGKLHGYMRMYWAKKILEWSESPEAALQIAIFLNDKYELDGRDPNGYAGCAWAIGGTHDRAWGERSVFGKIRYMNFNGCKRKFVVDEYISKFTFVDSLR